MTNQYYSAFKIQGTDRNGKYYESEEVSSPGAARAIARRKGGTYKIMSKLAPGSSMPGAWSGGECGNFK